MFIPYGDDNPRKNFPVVTVSLIIINVLIFAFTYFRSDYGRIVSDFGFLPADPHLQTAFTSMFLHADIFHLLFNMLFLWLFCDNLEDKFGSLKFTLFYFAGGLFALGAHFFSTNAASSSIPVIGASGAISAAMGGYMILFPKAKIRTVILILFIPLFIPFSAYVFLGLWFALQVLYSLVDNEMNSGVAFLAHIGGFVFGASVAMTVRLFFMSHDNVLSREEKMILQHERLLAAKAFEVAENNTEGAAALRRYNDEITGLLDAQDFDAALRKYSEFETHIIPGALSFETQKKIGNLLFDRGKSLLALQAFLRLAHYYRHSNDIAEEELRAGIMLSQSMRNPLAALPYLRKGIFMRKRSSDMQLFAAAESEFEIIGSMISDPPGALMAPGESGGKFALFALAMSGELFDEKKILDKLRYPGSSKAGTLTAGLPAILVANNAQNHLAVKDGVILDGLALDRAKVAAEMLRSIGIPVIVIGHKLLPSFRPAEYVFNFSANANTLLLVTEQGKNVQLGRSDIFYVVLGQLSLDSSGRTRSAENSTVFPEENVVRSERSHYNYLLDIFTCGGQRFRINSADTLYSQGERTSIDIRRFGQLMEDIAVLTNGIKLDASVWEFISTGVTRGRPFASIKDLNEQEIWLARIAHFYERIKATG